MNSRFRVIAGALAAVCLSSMLVPLSAAADATDKAQAPWQSYVGAAELVQQPCATVLFIGVRGSGEGQYDVEGLGATVGHVRDGVKSAIGPATTVMQIAASYPALPTDTIVGDLSTGNSKYADSIAAGAREVVSILQHSVDYCPEQQIVLVGYSQGAAAIHMALRDWSVSDQVVNVVLIADPGRDKAYPSAIPYGGPQREVGIVRAAGIALLPMKQEYRDRTIEYCKTHDPVCDTGKSKEALYNTAGVLARLNNDIGIHTSYKASHLEGTGRAIATKIRKSLPPPAAIAGSAVLGEPLTAVTGTWRGSAELSYQWYRDSVPIIGAATKTYVPVIQDAASNITVRVRGHLAAYPVKSVTSTAITLDVPKPRLAGAPKVGQTLTAKVGPWSPAPYSYTYQWVTVRNANGGVVNQNIDLPTPSKTFVVTRKDLGTTMQVCSVIVTTEPPLVTPNAQISALGNCSDETAVVSQ